MYMAFFRVGLFLFLDMKSGGSLEKDWFRSLDFLFYKLLIFLEIWDYFI